MTDTADGIAIEIIPIERITVLNPRVRDPKKFGEIVDSIENIGLKQPIKVSPAKGADGEVAYNLVYGQGRMEAFLALGQTEIPAIVTDLSEQDSLLVSLIENVARRQPRPGELFRAIGDLIERGYTNRKIAAKIGYSAEYVGSIRRLLEAGEERLLVAVETGKIPLRVAIAISVADDEQVQEVLFKGYKNGEVTLKQMPGARRAIEHRHRYGKAQKLAQGNRKRTSISPSAVVRDLKETIKDRFLLVKRADLASGQLRFLVQALRVLLSEDHFLTLLRAEELQTMPAPLARLLEAPEGT